MGNQTGYVLGQILDSFSVRIASHPGSIPLMRKVQFQCVRISSTRFLLVPTLYESALNMTLSDVYYPFIWIRKWQGVE